MSYEDFTQAFLKEIQRQAGEEYQVALQTIKKNNGVSRDAVSITRKDCKVAPLIYIGSFYERYQGGSSVVRLAACLLENYYEMDDSLLDINTDFFSDYENAKKHLYEILGVAKGIHAIHPAKYLRHAVVRVQEFQRLPHGMRPRIVEATGHIFL